MKVQALPLLIFALISLLISSCKQNTKTSDLDSSFLIEKTFTILDSTEAAQKITIDKHDQFFEKINKVDLRIQHKLKETDTTSREQLLENYKTLLQANVSDFNASEKKYLATTIKKAKKLIDQIDPSICKMTIELVKYSGLNYGKGTYYTRENRIIIPADKLVEKNRKPAAFLETMLHEIFHIYSRSNKEIKEELYSVIGFEREEQVSITPKLKERILLNPDGMDVNYSIQLEDESGRKYSAIPLIYSMFKGYEEDKVAYFDYISFDLFELSSQENERITLTNPTGFLSTIPTLRGSGFFEQIGSNTDYIIHPDEILADNFALLALSKEHSEILEELEPYGKKLIHKIDSIIYNSK